MVKVLVIGLDAAEPSLIEEWQDQLPNIGRIMREGVYARMRSSDPPQSVPAWNCLCTGKNPGKIGVYDFFYRESSTYRIRVVNSTIVRTPNVWKILSTKGKRVVIIGVPTTFPPEEVNGIMVCGLPLPVTEGKPVSNYTYPSELSNEIDKIVEGYEYAVSFNIPENFVVSDLSWATSTLAHDKKEGGLSRAEEKQLLIAKHLLQSSDWDYFMVVFRELDRVGHFMWKYMDKSHPQFEDQPPLREAIKRVYIRMDEIIGELLRLVGNDTIVLLVSDHGFGPLHRRFYVNEFLQRIGMLRLKRSKSVQVRLAQKLRFGAPEIMQILLNLRLHWIVRLVPNRFRQMVRSIDQFEGNLRNIDWAKTKAYSYGEIGRVFLNVKGREPHGIVEPGGEYDRVRDFIVQSLGALTDPASGSRIVDRVFKREEIYSGEFTEEAPDLLFYMDGLRCIASTRLGYRSLFDNESLTNGTHRPYGIFMAYGNSIRKGASVNLGICDIVPTILHIMGIPIPDDMDGTPIVDILEPDSEMARRPVAYEKPVRGGEKVFQWSPEEERKLEEQLRGLGYLG
jgi:predicted AlkP superfamily phosphohydrolase/phosphomutase